MFSTLMFSGMYDIVCKSLRTNQLITKNRTEHKTHIYVHICFCGKYVMPTTPLCFCFVSASSLFVSQVCTSLDREPAIEVNGADWPVFVITKAFSTFYIFLFYWLFRHLISSVSVQCSSKSSSSETISAQKKLLD